MDAKVKDMIDTFEKVIDTHIRATEVQLGSFPESQYWHGQLDALKNAKDALFIVEKQRIGVKLEKKRVLQ